MTILKLVGTETTHRRRKRRALSGCSVEAICDPCAWVWEYLARREAEDRTVTAGELRLVNRTASDPERAVERAKRRLADPRVKKPATIARRLLELSAAEAAVPFARKCEEAHVSRPRSDTVGYDSQCKGGTIWVTEKIGCNGARSLEFSATRPDGRLLVQIVVPGADEASIRDAFAFVNAVDDRYEEAEAST